MTHQHRDHLDDILNLARLDPRVPRRPKHLTEREIRAASQDPDRIILDEYFRIDARYSEPVSDTTNPLLGPNNGGASIQSF